MKDQTMPQDLESFPADYRVHARRFLAAARNRAGENIVEIIRQGLPVAIMERMVSRYDIPEEVVAHIMEISRSTLQRRKKSGRFLVGESDRFVRLIGLYAMAEDVLESTGLAASWMQEPNRSLGGEAPLNYADTEAGAREVEDLLGRIAHGVAA